MIEFLKSYPIKFVWSLTKRYLKEIGHSSVVIFILRVLGFISPILTMILIDDVLPHSQSNTLIVVMLAMLGIYIIETILNTVVDWMMFSSFTRLSADISTRIFDALFRLPFEFFTSNRTGGTVSKILSSNTLRAYLSEKPMKLIIDIIFGFSFLFFLVYLSPILTFVAVLTVPLDFYISFYWTKKRQFLADQSVALANNHNGTLVESINGAETIYQMDAKKFFCKTWFDEIVEILHNSIALKKIDTIFSVMQGSIGKISTVFTWWYGMYLIINGELKLGQFIAFTSYVSQLTGPIMNICELWKDFQTTAIAVDKLKDIIKPESVNQESAVLPSIMIGVGQIEICNLSFQYHEERVVLDDILLTIKQQEKVGIVGQSGCGKTTLVNLLQRLYEPTNGRILIDSQDISLFDPISLRKCFGVVSQTGVLFKRTIAENIALGFPNITMEDIVEASVCAEAQEFISKLPFGYGTIIEERGANLSNGQRQRIMIARAVIRKPKIFIFDEATAALDPETEKEVLQNLFKIAEGSSVIMISHQNAFKKYLDRIIKIENGKIV